MTLVSEANVSNVHDGPACARVKDPDVFFPRSKNVPVATVDVMRMCRTCPVRKSCASQARKHKEWGVWGGDLYEEGVVVRSGTEVIIEADERAQFGGLLALKWDSLSQRQRDSVTSRVRYHRKQRALAESQREPLSA